MCIFSSMRMTSFDINVITELLFLSPSRNHDFVFYHSNLFMIHFTERSLIISELLGNMNQSVDPCWDFYSFVCGNYIVNNKSEEEKEAKSNRLYYSLDFIKETMTDIFEYNKHINFDLSNTQSIYNNCKRLCKHSFFFICFIVTLVFNKFV